MLNDVGPGALFCLSLVVLAAGLWPYGTFATVVLSGGVTVVKGHELSHLTVLLISIHLCPSLEALVNVQDPKHPPSPTS